MRVAIVTRNLIPYPTGFGSAILVWSLVETFLKRGHEVHLCTYDFEPQLGKYQWKSDYFNYALDELAKHQVKVHLIKHKEGFPPVWKRWFNQVRRTINPAVSDFYRGSIYQADLFKTFDSFKPDALVLYMAEAVAATTGKTAQLYPRMAVTVDLDHLARQSARTYGQKKSLRRVILNQIDALADRKLPKLMTDLLADCEIVYDHAAHHCEWLRSRGVSHAEYLPVPVIDRPRESWKEKRDAALKNNKVPKISLIGRVTAAATLPGLKLVAQEFLSAFEREFGTEGFEIHIIGTGELSPDLRQAFDRPYIKIRGFVDDIHTEIRSSNVVFVPAPIELGFRTRIAESFSFGACVVSHEANGKGMPELQNEINALTGKNGQDLAIAVARCLRDSKLRERLGNAARQTFEEHLDGSKVCNAMVDRLEAVVHGEINA